MDFKIIDNYITALSVILGKLQKRGLFEGFLFILR